MAGGQALTMSPARLIIDDDEFRAHFPYRHFRVAHRLAGHPLFSLIPADVQNDAAALSFHESADESRKLNCAAHIDAPQ